MADDPADDDRNDDPLSPGGRLDPDRLTVEHGDAERALRFLTRRLNDVEKRGAGYRERLRVFTDRFPNGIPDDALVLTGDAKAAHEGIVKHLADAGLDTSEKLTAFIERATQDAAKVKQTERAAELARVAEAAGVSPEALPAVFTDGETFEIEGEGDERKVYVRPREGERVDFEAYVDANKAALKPALYANAEPANGTPAPPAGPRMTPMPSGGPPAPKRFDAETATKQKQADPGYAAAM